MQSNQLVDAKKRNLWDDDGDDDDTSKCKTSNVVDLTTPKKCRRVSSSSSTTPTSKVFLDTFYAPMLSECADLIEFPPNPKPKRYKPAVSPSPAAPTGWLGPLRSNDPPSSSVGK